MKNLIDILGGLSFIFFWGAMTVYTLVASYIGSMTIVRWVIKQ